MVALSHEEIKKQDHLHAPQPIGAPNLAARAVAKAMGISKADTRC
jgi:predicted transcriptional regulator